MTHGLFELLWIQRVLKDLRIECSTPISLFSDNKFATKIAQNLIQHDRTKHVEVDCHFIKEKLDEKIIQLPFVKSKN